MTELKSGIKKGLSRKDRVRLLVSEFQGDDSIWIIPQLDGHNSPSLTQHYIQVPEDQKTVPVPCISQEKN